MEINEQLVEIDLFGELGNDEILEINEEEDEDEEEILEINSWKLILFSEQLYQKDEEDQQ